MYLHSTNVASTSFPRDALIANAIHCLLNRTYTYFFSPISNSICNEQRLMYRQRPSKIFRCKVKAVECEREREKQTHTHTHQLILRGTSHTILWTYGDGVGDCSNFEGEEEERAYQFIELTLVRSTNSTISFNTLCVSVCDWLIFRSSKIHLTDMPKGLPLHSTHTHTHTHMVYGTRCTLRLPCQMTQTSLRTTNLDELFTTCVCPCACVCSSAINITFCTDYFWFFFLFSSANTNEHIFPRDVFTVWWPYLFEKDCNNNNSSCCCSLCVSSLQCSVHSVCLCVQCVDIRHIVRARSDDAFVLR